MKLGIVSFIALMPALVQAEEVTVESLMRSGVLTQRGKIYIDGSRVGEITQDGKIYINGSRAGEVVK